MGDCVTVGEVQTGLVGNVLSQSMCVGEEAGDGWVREIKCSGDILAVEGVDI